MKDKKEKRDRREKNKKLHKHHALGFKDYIVYLLVSSAMIFLTASFVVEDVYNRADRVQMTSESIKGVYSVNVGHSEAESLKELPAIPTEN